MMDNGVITKKKKQEWLKPNAETCSHLGGPLSDSSLRATSPVSTARFPLFHSRWPRG
jgi:hypothetical protein